MFHRVIRAFSCALLLLVAASASAQLPQLDLPRFDELEQALKLTPAQKEQYDLAVGATKRMFLHMAMTALSMKQRLADELARPRPDLGVLEDLRRGLVEDGKPLRREARDEWAKLYAMLDEAQVATLKRFLEQRLDRLGILHEFMLQLILGGGKAL